VTKPVIHKKDIDALLQTKRQCPVCLRKTLGWETGGWPPPEGTCPLCREAPDSEESKHRIGMYLQMQAHMMRMVPKRKP
jgi:hypothetical protein